VPFIICFFGGTEAVCVGVIGEDEVYIGFIGGGNSQVLLSDFEARGGY